MDFPANFAGMICGATEAKLQEALFSASATRAFSMIMKGSEVDFDKFKVEFQKMMAFMAEQAGKK